MDSCWRPELAYLRFCLFQWNLRKIGSPLSRVELEALRETEPTLERACLCALRLKFGKELCVDLCRASEGAVSENLPPGLNRAPPPLSGCATDLSMDLEI